MSTSSMNSLGSLTSENSKSTISSFNPKSTKKVPKDSARSDGGVYTSGETLQNQAETLKLELEALKAKMKAQDDTGTKQDSELNQKDKESFLRALNSFSSDLSSKLAVVRQLSLLDDDKPAVNIDEEALTKTARSFDAAKLIVDHMVMNKSEESNRG